MLLKTVTGGNREMEKEDGNQGALSMIRPPETEFFLQWGTRKRLRCVRIRSSGSPPHLFSNFSSDSSDPSSTTRIRRKISSRFLSSTNQAACRLTRYALKSLPSPIQKKKKKETREEYIGLNSLTRWIN